MPFGAQTATTSKAMTWAGRVIFPLDTASALIVFNL